MYLCVRLSEVPVSSQESERIKSANIFDIKVKIFGYFPEQHCTSSFYRYKHFKYKLYVR